MITKSNKELAQWAMGYALRMGCQQAKVDLSSGTSSSFEIREGKIDRLQQATESQMSISLYVDGRFGVYSTNRLDKKGLKTIIENGVDATRYLAKDLARVLPDPSRYYLGGKQDLKLTDASMSSITPDEKVALAKAVAEEVMGKDHRIVSVDSSYSDSESANYKITSNGFEGNAARTWCSLSASVSVKGEDEARPSGSWHDSALYYNELIKTDIGRKALERAVNKIGQQKVKSGRYAMVVDPLISSRLLGPLLNALSGAALQQKNSFLLEQQGVKIGSDVFTLTDEPHLIQAPGARYFDYEGVATTPRTVFDCGVLKTYYLDTYHALKMSTSATISTPSLLVMRPGDNSLDQLIYGVEYGILVTAYNGGNCNSSTGDFSYGVEGFLIEKGKLTKPISGMNITGNMITLWASLVAVGNDPRLNTPWRIPSLVFDQVNFSGL